MKHFEIPFQFLFKILSVFNYSVIFFFITTWIFVWRSILIRLRIKSFASVSSLWFFLSFSIYFFTCINLSLVSSPLLSVSLSLILDNNSSYFHSYFHFHFSFYMLFITRINEFYCPSFMFSLSVQHSWYLFNIY